VVEAVRGRRLGDDARRAEVGGNERAIAASTTQTKRKRRRRERG
jgi:hypothetical protein